MRLPATSIVPSVGRSRPARRFRRVLLPDPLGPMSASKDASGTSRSRFSRTRTPSVPRKYVLETPFKRMMTGSSDAAFSLYAGAFGSVEVVSVTCSGMGFLFSLFFDRLAVLELGARSAHDLRARGRSVDELEAARHRRSEGHPVDLVAELDDLAAVPALGVRIEHDLAWAAHLDEVKARLGHVGLDQKRLEVGDLRDGVAGRQHHLTHLDRLAYDRAVDGRQDGPVAEVR